MKTFAYGTDPLRVQGKGGIRGKVRSANPFRGTDLPPAEGRMNEESTLATPEESRRAWRALEESGAYRKGHFVIKETGLHYDEFFQVALALQHTEHARVLCVALGRILRRSGILSGLSREKRFTLVAPEDAGIPVSFWLGEHLGADRILWVRKRNGEVSLRPLISIDSRDQVVLVDDAVLTGTTLKATLDYVEKKGCEIRAVAAIVDRRETSGPFGHYPFFALLRDKANIYKPESCPLCKKGEKLVELALA